MTESDYASRQLRVIRSLMERATIYRSISAPMALVGGLLSLSGFATAWYAESARHHPLTPGNFRTVWLVILALTAATNFFFLARGATRRGEPFFSSGMKCALLSLAPAFLVAGVLTVTVHRPIELAVAWITLYGLGLLGTQHFAPRSLIALGAVFLLAGGVLLATWKHLFMPNPHLEPSALVVSGIMAATFGGFHLVYAVAVGLLEEDRADAPAALNETGHV
jgi:hypothetical protein